MDRQAGSSLAYITVKRKIYKKKLKTDQTNIDIHNKFDILCDETPKFSMITQEEEDNRSKTHKLCKRVPKNNFEKVTNRHFNTEKQAVKCYDLKYFGSRNRSAVLQDNQEERVEQMLERNIETQKILNTKKQLLKKCRRCNFKNRLCMLNRSNCPTLNKNCFYCLKGGHYPQSLCCKKKRKSKLKKLSPLYSEKPQPTKIGKNVIELINTRIKQLEPTNLKTINKVN